jgi:hypothetical protein
MPFVGFERAILLSLGSSVVYPIFADFLLNVDFSSHVAWSVSCPGGRIEEGKPPDPFVLPYSLPSILPPG